MTLRDGFNCRSQKGQRCSDLVAFLMQSNTMLQGPMLRQGYLFQQAALPQTAGHHGSILDDQIPDGLRIVRFAYSDPEQLILGKGIDHGFNLHLSVLAFLGRKTGVIAERWDNIVVVGEDGNIVRWPDARRNRDFFVHIDDVHENRAVETPPFC